MKKLSDFNWKETKNFILTLKSQLALITNDGDLKAVLKTLQDIKRGKDTDKTYLDAVYAVIDSLFTTNEKALDTIVAACMQITPEELQKASNLNVIETVIDFLAIDTYKKLLSRGIVSVTKGV